MDDGCELLSSLDVLMYRRSPAVRASDLITTSTCAPCSSTALTTSTSYSAITIVKLAGYADDYSSPAAL